MTLYSYSRLAAFRQCRLRYKFSYVDRIRREEDSIEAFLGSRFHEVMDRVYKERDFWHPTAEDLCAYFDDRWDAAWGEHVYVTREGRTPDDYRAIGHKAIEAYHRRYAPFADGRVMGIERRVVAHLDASERYVLQGFIDRLMQTKDGHFEIHDYKTSAQLPTQADLDADEQLALYEVAIREQWPNEVRDVELVWHYVAFDQEMRSRRTSEELDDLKARTRLLIDEIEATTEFPPHESHLCAWCEHQQICPLFAHQFRTEGLPRNEYRNEKGVVLVDRFAYLDAHKHELQAEIAAIEEEQARIAEAAIEHAASEHVERLFGSEATLRVGSDLQVTYPKKESKDWEAFEAALKALGLWERVTGVNWASIKGEARRSKWDQELPEPLAPFVKIEKKKTVKLGKRREGE